MLISHNHDFDNLYIYRYSIWVRNRSIDQRMIVIRFDDKLDIKKVYKIHELFQVKTYYIQDDKYKKPYIEANNIKEIVDWIINGKSS